MGKNCPLSWSLFDRAQPPMAKDLYRGHQSCWAGKLWLSTIFAPPWGSHSLFSASWPFWLLPRSRALAISIHYTRVYKPRYRGPCRISFSWNPVTKNLTSQNLTSLTKPLPKLELTKQPSQKRGRWKRAKKETCNCLTSGWRSSVASGFRRALEWP